jgi:hypothetical protein
VGFIMALKPMYNGIVNSPPTKISGSVSAVDTIIILDNPSVIPDAPNIFTIGSGSDCETVYFANSPSGSSFTVVRGFQGIAKSWDADTIVFRSFTEYDYAAIIENIQSTRSASAIIDFGFPNGLEGDTYTVYFPATWVTDSSVISCSVKNYSPDHTGEDVAVENIGAYVTEIVSGSGFYVTAVAPQNSWGRYIINILGKE